jgi:predicted Zn-dependent protease with MMP-like domain
MDEQSKDLFDSYIQDSIIGLPGAYRSALDNVTISAQDLATPGQCARSGVDDPYRLFGLYEGIPKIRRARGYQMAPPDRITLFRIPILSASSTHKDAVRRIRDVLYHEIGHHFGLSEEELRDA